MIIKEDVKIFGFRPEMAMALLAVEAAARYISLSSPVYYEATITSGVDSLHSRTSLHYNGCGLDVRKHDLPEGVSDSDYAMEIRKRLTDEFDVIVENSHIHIEFQPKRQMTV